MCLSVHSLLFAKEDSEAVQYRVLSSNIIDNLVPVLEGMEGEEVPTGWVDSCTGILGPLVYELQVMALATEGIERNQIEFLQPVVESGTGRPGRPKKHINPRLSEGHHLCQSQHKLSTLAAALGVHRNTLRKRMRELGIYQTFAELSDDELDQLTREYKTKKPTSGLRYLRGHFHRHVCAFRRNGFGFP
ncbi:hypothetical protein B0H14DRAFT_2625727 [Mycena olivaceomarginata]|nr:hypothetical protein B0H14DRAFT_2625727 [Mycena olivaceomarginata]